MLADVSTMRGGTQTEDFLEQQMPELPFLHKELDEITKKRAMNALLPVEKLPPELLSQIFRFALVNVRSRIWSAGALGVSHRWRECALQDAFLWCSIRITSRTTINKLERWLKLSRAAILDVDVRCAIDINNNDALIYMLYRHEERIRLLHLCFDEILAPFIPFAFNYTTLEDLSLSWTAPDHGIAMYPTPPLFSSHAPPNLRKLALSIDGKLAYEEMDVATNHFSPELFESLQFSNAVSTPDICALLPTCHNIRELTWEHWEDPYLPARLAPYQGIHLDFPLLSNLRINGLITYFLLERIRAPKLTHLSIGETEEEPDTLSVGVPELIGRFGSLRSLHLMDFYHPMTADDIKALFSSLPMLERLLYDQWTVENAHALEALSEPSRESSSPLQAPKIASCLSTLGIWGGGVFGLKKYWAFTNIVADALYRLATRNPVPGRKTPLKVFMQRNHDTAIEFSGHKLSDIGVHLVTYPEWCKLYEPACNTKKDA
ncbi:hypothetical protein DL93DRAFT_111770 [Clavulina sp. PMI_390]|nr:hypothetical protein DL93DRAFT_111770 [Clavulina sp. PMI_390]